MTSTCLTPLSQREPLAYVGQTSTAIRHASHVCPASHCPSGGTGGGSGGAGGIAPKYATRYMLVGGGIPYGESMACVALTRSGQLLMGDVSQERYELPG